MWHLQCWINVKHCWMGHGDRGAFHTSTQDTKVQHLNGALWSTVCLCVCAKQGGQSTAAQHFPKTHRCSRLELHKCNSYKMHGESITWWTRGPQVHLLVYPEQWEAEPKQCGKGRQFMQFNQSQMCVSVRDPGGETWDIEWLQGLARAAHLSSVFVSVCVVDLCSGMCCIKLWGNVYGRAFVQYQGSKSRDMFHISSHWK